MHFKIVKIKKLYNPSMILHSCNPSSQQAEAEGFQVQDHPGPCINNKQTN
jgi:hypothetical protein